MVADGRQEAGGQAERRGRGREAGGARGGGALHARRVRLHGALPLLRTHLPRQRSLSLCSS